MRIPWFGKEARFRRGMKRLQRLEIKRFQAYRARILSGEPASPSLSIFSPDPAKLAAVAHRSAMRETIADLKAAALRLESGKAAS